MNELNKKLPDRTELPPNLEQNSYFSIRKRQKSFNHGSFFVSYEKKKDS